MGTKIGDLFYKITGDSSALDKNIKKSNKEVGLFGKGLSSVGGIIKGALFTGALIAGARKVAEFGKQIITAASNTQETSNKFTVVFETVADDARAAADRIKDEFKLSDETVEKFLSGVGDITSGLGATSTEALSAAEQITSLGLDINSFANLSGGAEQAVSALTSLFTGEREAAKALGIVINDTNLKAYAEDMGKVFKELTPLEKGFLSLELATKQSELALGDFARSSDSYANTAKAAEEATKDFKAALGESLLPAATESLNIFTSLTTKLTDYIKEHNELRVLLDKFEDDNDTAQDRVDLVEREIAVTQKLYDDNLKLLEIANRRGANNQNEKFALDLLFNKSSQLNTEIRAKERLLAILEEEAAAEKAVADEIKAKQDKINQLATVQLDLASTLEDRRKAALTDEDKAIDNIDKQIDKWVQFREVEGVQALINDLVAERNVLLKEQEEAIKEALGAGEEAAVSEQEFYNQFVGYQEDELALIYNTRDERIQAKQDAIDATLEAEKEAAAERLRIEQELQRNILATVQFVGSQLSAILTQRVANARSASEEFLSINQAEITSLEAKAESEEGLTEDEKLRLEELNQQKKELAQEQYDREIEAFKANKILKIAETIQTGASAAIAAYGALAGIPLVGPALGVVAAASVATLTGVQVGLIAAQDPPPAPSFANGGIVPGRPSNVDNTVANVASGELVANQPQKDRMLMEFLNGGGSGSGNVIHNVVNLDGKAIIDFMTKASKNRTFITSAGSVK